MSETVQPPPSTVPAIDRIPEPDIEHIVIEDDAPVDSWYSEKQMRLLPTSLYASWKPPEGRSFECFSDVGLFIHPDEPPLVPDVMLSLDVQIQYSEARTNKKHKTYFIWVFGKAPELVIEVVSNKKGGEEEKASRYARMGVSYYAILDPDRHLSDALLRFYKRDGSRFVRSEDYAWLPDLGLGLTLWKGSFEGWEDTWLRWCDAEGKVLPTGAEAAAEAEQGRAEAEQGRAEAEQGRAEAEQAAAAAEARAAALAERLRALGVDPDSL